MENKKYAVVSIHPWTGGCNLNCEFCYKKHKTATIETKNKQFWLDLIPYMKQLTDQIACGADGEPFMDIELIKDLAKEAKKCEMLFNVTTNGRLLMSMNDEQLKATLKDVCLLSISYDDYKIQSKLDHDNYMALVKRIKELTKCQVGSNLLINNDMFKNKGKGLYNIVELLFKGGVDRVFCLHPKNMAGGPKILDFKPVYTLLTMKFKNFFVDDLTKQIIQEGSYGDWKNACHYGKDLISINELGIITGCSFDPNDKALLKIEKPSDLLKVVNIKVEERFNCPYLIK